MVRITESLIRKKSEHNELIISTLEEISLHQENIEKIEHIHDWCRDLKIILFQNNLISKLENLFKLKKLEYLNLAINNIEKIENLDKLESLTKLDLTLNFIGELTSVESLQNNDNLRELILTGNPCTDYEGYRDFVIVTLPQLRQLDNKEITRTDLLKSMRNSKDLRNKIVQQEAEYSIKRDEQKIRVKEQQEKEEEENAGLDDDEKNRRFWQKKSEHCPETRIEISKQHEKNKPKDEPKKKPKRQPRLFAENGRPYCINQSKYKFNLIDERSKYELELHTYKFMDTSLMNVDVQPNYVRITIKNKVFQMALNDEVKTTESTSQRSLITGHLHIVMPKLNYKEEIFATKAKVAKEKEENKKKPVTLTEAVNYRNICNDGNEVTKKDQQLCVVDDSIDDSTIPPLI